MSTVEPIKITGLRDMQAAFRQMDADLPKLIRVALNESATTVAQGAARRVPSRSGRARGSLKASSSQREARVKGGSVKAPYYGFLDFGGTVGPGRSGPGTGSVRRPFVQSGRYLYPTFSANRDSIFKAVQDSLVKLAQNAGVEVS